MSYDKTFLAIYDGLNATYAALESPPKLKRAEGEIWTDAQGRKRFQFENISWDLTRPQYVPAEVRRAWMDLEIEMDRERKAKA